MSPTVEVSVTDHGSRRTASTGSAWEPVIGYSRAVRVDGVEADGSFAPDLKAQARRALTIILAAIEALGGKASDVVRTRIYLTDIAQWREVGEAHGEIFGQIRPATTMVEIEADALVRPEVSPTA